DGVLATITPAKIPQPTAAQIARRQAEVADPSSKDYDQFTYTLRVQVLDQPGHQLGEDRRTIFIHDDPDLKARYPLQLGAEGGSTSWPPTSRARCTPGTIAAGASPASPSR